MAKSNPLDTTIRIPVITDLVTPGDPEVINEAKAHLSHRKSDYERNLKHRIDELTSATGQDEYGNLARAHAIRSEASNNKQERKKKILESEKLDNGYEDDFVDYLPNDNKRFAMIRENS